ncbi:MAG: hypothetical protein R2712_27290 [Vicinamibacterales bacterium]
MPARSDAWSGWPALAAVMLALLVLAPSAYRLSAVPPQFPLRSWLIEEPSPYAARPLPLEAPAAAGNETLLRIPIETESPAALARIDRVEIVLGTYGTAPELIGASMTFGAACRFVAPSTAALADNATLVLERETCRAPTAEGLLEVRIVPGSGRAALWTLEAPTGASLLAAVGTDGRRFAVRGWSERVPQTSAATRADLLAAMWAVSPRTV